MTNSEYWKKRAEERKNHVSRTADEAAEEARGSYERAKHRINKEVAYWIQKFADAEGISYDEAKKLLEAGELEKFRMTLEEYIARGKALDVDPEWQDAMVKASALHHIDRLNALKAIIRAELEENKARLKRSQWMHDIADYSYEHTLFGIETGLEIQINFRQPDLDTLHRDIEEAWAPDGIDFANRVGINNDKLAAEVDRLLTQGMITGETYEELSAQLADQFALKEYEAARIIRTEATRVASMSEAAAYRTAGLEEYEILVTLDERTCSICGPMDGHVERVDDMEPGVTAPPFHPNCRCTTIGHYEDGLIDETRIARDEDGKPIHVDGDMTWEEWRKEYKDRDDITLDVVEGEERNRRIRLGKARSFDSDYGTIHAHAIKNTGNDLYLADGVALSREQARQADRLISSAKMLHGIANECNIPFVITENESRLAAYNPRTNVITISRQMLGNDNPLKLQDGFACSDNIDSTLVHELFHWKDAEEYRDKYGAIKSSTAGSEYVRHRNKVASEALRRDGYNLSDGHVFRKEISEYAYNNFLDNDFDEVYTELRTKRLLEGT